MTSPLDTITQHGTDAYGPEWSPTLVATAPGRLELLGNHVDYSGGIVLAGAIDRVIRAEASESAPRKEIRLLAPDVSAEVATVDPAAPGVDETAASSPANYLAGIVAALGEAGIQIRTGLDIVVSGDVPVGFGMSSSAALCVSLTLLLADADLPDKEVVNIARRAEHLTGAPVGAMDQSASVAGGVILFDGGTGDVRQIEPDLGNHVFAVANSGVHHALNDSAYPARVRESEAILNLIREHTDIEIEHLGQIGLEDWRRLEASQPSWLDATLRARVRHVATEVDRVRQGVAAIEAREWERFGALMTASGRSSATDYEISHPVVEELVAELRAIPGVLGARMMGGGEGGPALALLDREAVEPVRRALASGFFARHGMDAADAFEVCTFGPGARLERVTPAQ
jgi:galactokinase